jgi:Family of unknown function (DUF5678)
MQNQNALSGIHADELTSCRIDQLPIFTYDSAGGRMTAVADQPNSPIDLAPYAGRWIALVREHIAGVGCTAAEALALSKAARPKEEPIVVFVPEDYADTATG